MVKVRYTSSSVGRRTSRSSSSSPRSIAAARGDELPGPERLPTLAEAFEHQSGIPASFHVEGEARELAPDTRLAIYRTPQEALTNVRKHATPERVQVQLDYRSDATVLVIEDHAPPRTPPPAALSEAGGGFGLTGLQERAELLGGKLIAGPTVGGFRVELWLPSHAEPTRTQSTAATTAGR